MKLIGLEIKKLLLNKVLYLFIGACLIFNFAVIALTSDERDFVSYVSETVNITGDQANASFLEYLNAQPENPFRNRLIANCADAAKIYDSFDAVTMGKDWYYDEYYTGAPFLTGLLMKKYGKLNNSVQQLNLDNADLSVYAADATNKVHDALFTYVLKSLLVEGFILISFLTIYTMGMERQNSTTAIVYCSRRGRSLVKDKMVATGIVNACCILFLYVITLLILFSVWDLGRIWDSNVASCFHKVRDDNLPFDKPFLTWASFTVKEYFVASLLLEIILLAVWQLISSCVSILVCHSANGFLINAAILISPYFLSVFFVNQELWWLFYLNTFSISMLTLHQHLWFTDLGAYELIPWQEVWSAAIHLLVCVIFFFATVKRFKRKELL